MIVSVGCFGFIAKTLSVGLFGFPKDIEDPFFHARVDPSAGLIRERSSEAECDTIPSSTAAFHRSDVNSEKVYAESSREKRGGKVPYANFILVCIVTRSRFLEV